MCSWKQPEKRVTLKTKGESAPRNFRPPAVTPRLGGLFLRRAEGLAVQEEAQLIPQSPRRGKYHTTTGSLCLDDNPLDLFWGRLLERRKWGPVALFFRGLPFALRSRLPGEDTSRKLTSLFKAELAALFFPSLGHVQPRSEKKPPGL